MLHEAVTARVADVRPCVRAASRAEQSAAARVGREAEAGARSELLLNELEGLEASLDGPPELEAVAPAPSALAVPSALDHLCHTRPISVQAARWAGGARRTHPTSPYVAPSLHWPRGELGRANRGTPAAYGRSARRHASVATIAAIGTSRQREVDEFAYRYVGGGYGVGRSRWYDLARMSGDASRAPMLHGARVGACRERNTRIMHVLCMVCILPLSLRLQRLDRRIPRLKLRSMSTSHP